jgi:hypothetical protein
MDFRSGSRVLDIALIAVIVAGTALNFALLTSSIPTLAGLYAGVGLALPLPLQLYIRAANAAAILGSLAALVVLGGWAYFRAGGQAFRVHLRAVLMVIVAGGGVLTAMGLYTFGRASLLHAVRLSVATSAPVQVLNRDLSLLYLAVGEPREAVALLQPRVTGDETRTAVRFGSPGEAFLLAESYRSANDIDAARRLYQRAQEAAVRFDGELTQRLLANQVRWRSQFGADFPDWLPPASDLQRLPELIRTVSQQRLDQLAAQQP